MRAEIEDIPFKNRGITVTSETAEEKEHLESLWNRNSAALMFIRNPDETVTLVVGPDSDKWKSMRNGSR